MFQAIPVYLEAGGFARGLTDPTLPLFSMLVREAVWEIRHKV